MMPARGPQTVIFLYPCQASKASKASNASKASKESKETRVRPPHHISTASHLMDWTPMASYG